MTIPDPGDRTAGKKARAADGPAESAAGFPVYTAGEEPLMNARTPLAKYSGELLRAVIDNLAEGVLIYDSDGKVITANPAAEAVNIVRRDTACRIIVVFLDAVWGGGSGGL